MILLGVSEAALAYGDREILSDITFSVCDGDRVGVIGENGAGKTTLFRMITGMLPPDRGMVSIAKGKTVGMLEQQVDLSKSASKTLCEFMYEAFDELIRAEAELAEIEKELAKASSMGDTNSVAKLSQRYDEMSRRFGENGGIEFRARCRSMLTHLGFPQETQNRRISEISGGQHTRLALARLLAKEPDLLLLDEPTNHLDIDALAWLEEYIAGYRRTVMIISHDRYFLDKTTTSTLEIERTHAKMYIGNYTAAKEKRFADEASLEKRRREQQKVRDRIEANIAFQRRCGQEHNFVTIRSKQKQLDRMEKIEKNSKLQTIHFQFSALPHSANDVLRVKGLSFGYSDKMLMEDVNFVVSRGERILLLGQNGCGKSTLLRLICGMMAPSCGWVELGYGIKIGYYDQEMRGLDTSGTVLGELESAYPQSPVRELRSALAQFLFTADDIDRPISSLSGGERARLMLCKLMLRKVNLLILDEPTNHLDISSREMLESALSEFDGTVIAVSHDRYFIDRVASRILELAPPDEGGLIDFRSDENERAYTSYLRLRTDARPETGECETEETQSETKQQYEQQKKARAEEQSRRRKTEQAQRRVTILEAELTEIDRKIADAGSDYSLLTELERRRTEAEEELLALYEILL